MEGTPLQRRYFSKFFPHNFYDEGIIARGGRLLKVFLLYDSPPNQHIFSVKIDGVWVGDIKTEEEFSFLYRIVTGEDLLTLEEYNAKYANL